MDSADSGACDACDSARGERQPRRARSQSSDRSSSQRSDTRYSVQHSCQHSCQSSDPRPQFQRQRCCEPARQHQWRRGGFELRDRLRSSSSSIRSSSVRPSSFRWSHQVVVSKSRRMPVARDFLRVPSWPWWFTFLRTDPLPKNAQLCFACRSRAKVSSFPLADRLAERMRAVQITR